MDLIDSGVATAALSSARKHLSRGEIGPAAAVLIAHRSQFRGSDAHLAAELLIAARRVDEATVLAEHVATEQSDAWEWIRRFAGHMRARGNLAASRRVLHAFIAAHPSHGIERLHADIALALGVPAAYASTGELDSIRSEYLRNLSDFVAAYPPAMLREIHARADDLTWCNFFNAYQGGNDVVAQSLYGDWLTESLSAVAPLPPLAAPNNDRPTIAVVSARLHECTVGWYFATWMEHLAHRAWDVTLVHTPDARRDELTQRLASQCRGETVLSGNLADAAAQIRALHADIVLYPELGMDGFTFALAAQRLAPTQVGAWGHPVTTGLPTIDVFLSCDAMEPADAAAHYRERLIRLPGIGTRYMSPPLPSHVERRDLRLPEGRPLYLVPQALYKLHPDSDRLLVEIVRRDPSALFVLFELRPPSPSKVVNERLLRALGAVSAQPATHLFWMPECSRADYLRINQACSVMIDTPHWSGGNASLDALHCGLPIVTLPGRFMRGRQSAAMLRLLGCDELICSTVDEFADIAVSVAHDGARRQRIVERIRIGMPALTQSDAALEMLDDVLRALL